MSSKIIIAALMATTTLAQSLGGYGSVCQPSVVSATQCASGFTCILDTPNLPGGKGICHQLSSEGQNCGGGSIQYPAVCDTGLSCVSPATVPGSIQSGTCQATSTTSSSASQATTTSSVGGYGAECQPSVPSATRCGTGFTCILTVPNLPGGKGFCHALSKVGESCGGGSIQFPAVCENGATCVMPSPVAGSIQQGTCQNGGADTVTTTAAPTTAATTAASTSAVTKVVTTNLKTGGAEVAATAGLACVTVVGMLTAGGVGGTYDLVVEGETAAGGVDFAAVQVEEEGVGDGFVDGVFTAGGTVVLTSVHVEDVEGVGDGCLAAGGVLQVGTAGTNTVVGVLTAGGTAGTNTVVGVLAAGGVGGTYGRVVEGDTAAGGVDFAEVQDEEAGVGFVEGVLTAGGTVVFTAVQVVVEGVGDGCLAAGGVLQLGTAGTNTVEGVLTAGGVGGKYGRPVVEGVTTAGGVDLTVVQVDKVDGVALVEGVFTAGGVDLAVTVAGVFTAGGVGGTYGLPVVEGVTTAGGVDFTTADLVDGVFTAGGTVVFTAVQVDEVEGVGDGCFAAGGVLQVGTAGTNTVVGVLAAGGVGGTYGRVVEGDTAAGGVDFTDVHEEEAGVGFVEGVLTAGGTVVFTPVQVVVEGVGDGCFAAGGVLQLGTAGTYTLEGVLTAGGAGGTYGLPEVAGVTTAGGVDLICTEAVQVVVLEDFAEGVFTAGGVFEVNGFESDFVLGEFTAGGVDLLAVHEDGVGEGCFATGGVLQLGTAGTTTEDGVLTAGGVGRTYGTLVAGDATAGGVDFAVQEDVNGEPAAGGVAFEDSVQERVEGESAAGGVVLTGVEVQLLDAEWAPAGGRLG
ncbi:hypothetical protein HDU80_010368 [Chytriomyces hyalinus]|nr:hypothetical protein HDU80_010368 [Chytriomyces hyalinus]